MKKILISVVLILLVLNLFGYILHKKAINTRSSLVYEHSRDVPEWEFIVDPTSLITTYYDYMPGSYNSLPVRIQPAVSEPYGYPAGGVYILYHTQETSSIDRREYYSYIDDQGNVLASAPVSNTPIWEGYGGIDIDPVTADPFVSYHINFGTLDATALFSYDLFHMLGASGLWRETYPVIVNSELDTPYPDDSFCWPYTFIGPSPLEDHRRVYIYANNYQGHGADGNPSENVLIAIADFNTSDIDNQSSLDWTYSTIPLMDEWNGDPWIRPFKACAVSDDGKIAFMGYNTEDEIFVFYNDNYGEGEYTYYSQDLRFWIDNPMNQQGTEYTFENDNGNPYDLYFGMIHAGHMNAIFTDNDMKIRITGALGLQGDDPDGGDGVYWPYAIYPKAFEFDIASQSFSFYDLDYTGADPDDNIPMIPWDINEDGAVDEYDDEGNVLWYSGWPIYFYDNDTAFHENVFKIVKNEENGWLAAVWHDGLKSKLANAGEEGYEDWIEVPEIAISVSSDNGGHWSEPIFMNSLDTPELTDMIPVYVYPGDVIEDLGDNHGRLHLFFLDDYSYGSSIHGFGLNNGGMLNYAAIDIEFPAVSVGDGEIDDIEFTLHNNYPNPFHAKTTISFFTAEDTEDAEIMIYNIKGQKVKQLSIENRQSSIEWNGKDDHDRNVASGIYFYKLKVGRRSQTKKMILLKR